jgi:lysophospholipase L1-like esterase
MNWKNEAGSIEGFHPSDSPALPASPSLLFRTVFLMFGIMLRSFFALLLFLASVEAIDLPKDGQPILFLGDSITHSGQYIDDFELFLAVKYPEQKFTVINCGLPSETVSGLSEAGHADGKFPRPDLHERLDRVLATVKPKLVFACYGMNCGIYLPFDESRFAKYREGIEKLRAKVKAAGAEIVHLTPPVFDALPLKGRVVPADQVKDGQQSENYNEVLTRYSEWLVEQGKKQGWEVIDVHTAMSEALRAARQSNPAFTFAKDGVHANEQGHRIIAGSIIAALGTTFDFDDAAYTPIRVAIRKRGRILTDAYLTAAGHQRPGMNKGLPLAEAQTKAAAIVIPSATP